MQLMTLLLGFFYRMTQGVKRRSMTLEHVITIYEHMGIYSCMSVRVFSLSQSLLPIINVEHIDNLLTNERGI